MQYNSKRHNIFPIRTSLLISSAKKLKACRNSKSNFLNSCFISSDTNVKIVVAFTEHDTLHLLKYYPVKVPQIILSIGQIKQPCRFPKFCLP